MRSDCLNTWFLDDAPDPDVWNPSENHEQQPVTRQAVTPRENGSSSLWVDGGRGYVHSRLCGCVKSVQLCTRCIRRNPHCFCLCLIIPKSSNRIAYCSQRLWGYRGRVRMRMKGRNWGEERWGIWQPGGARIWQTLDAPRDGLLSESGRNDPRLSF